LRTEDEEGRVVTGLAITALTLSQFRSYRMARLRFDGRPAVLFGANGAGKTGVLEAVSLLSPGRGLRRAALGDLARRPEAPGWKIEARAHCLDRMHEIATWSEGTEARQVRIDGKAAPQTALARVVRILWLVPAMDRMWIDAAEGRRRFLDRMTLSFCPDHAEASLAYEKAMRERNRLLRDGITDAMWHGALEGQMAKAGATIIANRALALSRLEAAQDGADTAFPRGRPGGGAGRGAAARPGGRAGPDRPASHRSGGSLCLEGRCCGSMFHRRTEGPADFADPGQCPRPCG